MKMKVMISWSGPCAKMVGVILRDFLPRIVQALDPWMSEIDLESGQRWQQEVGQQLNDHHIGISVITRQNVKAPWLNFEAGAISKSVKHSRVIPLLFDLKPSDVIGPIMQFQARMNSKEDVRLMLRDLNELLDEDALVQSHLDDTFERFWPSMERKFEEVRNSPVSGMADPAPSRSDREILEEILGVVRSIGTSPAVLNEILALVRGPQTRLGSAMPGGVPALSEIAALAPAEDIVDIYQAKATGGGQLSPDEKTAGHGAGDVKKVGEE